MLTAGAARFCRIIFSRDWWAPAMRTLALRCKTCGEKFSAAMPRAGRAPGYCSEDCRKRRPSVRTKIAKACAVCGEPFETTSQARAECCGTLCGQILAKRRSDPARSANARARLARFCLNCGDPFTARNSSGKARAGKSREGRFCSRRCRDSFSRRKSELELFSALCAERVTP
jgi:hypothetical protein